MNLRRRVFSIILVASAVMLVVLTGLIILIVYTNSAAIDSELATDNSNRVQRVISDNFEKLQARAVSWAYWTDANDFVKTKDTGFIESELNDQTLADSGFVNLAYMDKNRNVIYSRSIDPETGAGGQLPQGLMQYILFNSTLFQQQGLTDSISGFISLPEGIFLVSAINVLNSDNTGPSNGYMVVAEPLDEKVLGEIGNFTGLDLKSYPINSTNNPQAVISALTSLISGSDHYLAQLGNGVAASYVLLEDVLGQPTSILEISFPSTVFTQTTNILRFLLPALLIIALGYGITISLLMNRYVVNPLVNLDSDLESISRSEERGGRVHEIGDLEIKSLSGSINSLLSSNETSESDLKRSVSQLLTISEINRFISGLLDPETLLPEVVNLIKNRLDLYYVGIFLLDPNKEFAVLQAGTGDAGLEMLARGHKLAVGGVSMIGWSTAMQKSRIALDVGKDAIRFSNPLLPETRSELAIPIISRNVTIGALSLQSREPNAFNDNDIFAFQGIADSLAVALENSRLFQDARTNLKEIQSLNRIYLQKSWGQGAAAQESLQYSYEEKGRRQKADNAESVKIPLMLRDQPLGEIGLEVEKGSLTAENQAVIAAIADQTAQALENVRLLEETQERAAREEKINDLVLKFSGAATIDEILRVAAQEIGGIPLVTEVNLHLGQAEGYTNPNKGQTPESQETLS